MTNSEMIQAFRVYGQQMGMQKMRNILDEEIYVFLNSAVVEKIRQVLGTNVVAQFPDKVSTQQNSISPINYVRTLVKTQILSINGNVAVTPQVDNKDIQIMYILGVTADGHKCRFIEPTDIETTIDDFCNAPSKEYPIFTFINNSFRLYNGTPIISEAVLKYIAMPAKISTDTSCNLPEYTHDEIVQLAVQKYFASLNNTQKVN